jgi:hypothetical protein
MEFSDLPQVIAVILEVAVMVIAAAIAFRYRKTYGWCIAVTFGLFVLFDIGRLVVLPFSDAAHSLIFLIACASMLYGVWLLYRDLKIAANPKR